jgi:hypothetical protein
MGWKIALLFLLNLLLIPGCRNTSGSPEAAAPSPYIIQSGIPNDLELSLTRISEQGIFEVTVQSQLDPIVPNKIHSWIITVTTAQGEAVENAAISVGHLMPQHGHGMPNEPLEIQYLGGGEYLVGGMEFNMTGWWEIEFMVETPNSRDVVTFNLILTR